MWMLTGKAAYFVAGAVVAIVGGKALKEGKIRDLGVKGLAKGIELQEDAKVYYQNVKEGAADLYDDAADLRAEQKAAAADDDPVVLAPKKTAVKKAAPKRPTTVKKAPAAGKTAAAKKPAAKK